MKIIEQSIEMLYPLTKEDWLREAKLIEIAGRNCYKSEGAITEDSWKNFNKGLKKRNHKAVIEFGNFVIRLITNRGVMAELTRHRLASFCIESTRWCNYSADKFGDEITIVRPSTWNQYSEKAKEIWNSALLISQNYYFEMLENGCKPEQARGVLAHDLKTDIVMKVNFTELMHIINLRTAKDAHPDIVALFNMVKDECIKNLPELFGD